MSKKNESLVLGKLLKKIAPSIGASVLLDPTWGIVGQITFKSGKRSYFRYNTLDLNPVGSSDVAKDKDYANFFMESMGYKTVPRSRTFFSKEWAEAVGAPKQNIDAACAYAEQCGFPVIVKPNSGSQGTNVTLVYTKAECCNALKTIFASDKIALVQEYVQGKDYRLVVLDNTVVSAYERIPLNVQGDGWSTISELLQKKQEEFLKKKRDTLIKLSDSRISAKLKRQKLTFQSVIPKGKKVYLLDNANLSTGGDSIDVTDVVHPSFKKLAIALTKDMGLRLCGVDVIVQGDITKKPDEYWILEINAAPGLDHYVKIGTVQKKIVEALYLCVLKHLEK